MERPSWGIPFLGCTIAIIAAFSVSCVADLHAIRPFDDVDLDATTSRLLDSFARLVNDSANVANKSEFTQLLSDAALRVIYNVPPALVTQKVATQTEEAASRMALPNPDDEGCTARDYSAMCPMDFYDAGDGKTCKALPTYAGDCERTQDFGDATAMEKRVFAARCKTNWPCKESCAQDFRFNCPQGWTDTHGRCIAPQEYKGDCVRQKDFRGFNESTKRNWAERCAAPWPCKRFNFDFDAQTCPTGWTEKSDGVTCEAPPSYLGPCASTQEIGTMTREKKEALARLCRVTWPSSTKAVYDFTRPCPLGWKRLSEQYPECHAPKDYDGPCQKLQSFEGFTADQKNSFSIRCGVRWPKKGAVQRNYKSPCPAGWTLEANGTGICQAPETYEGSCEPRLSFREYSEDMKRAWEEACEAYFPVSVMAAAPKLSAFFPRQEVLQVEGRGPVGSAGTRYAGNVLEPNGTVYLPSRQYQVHSPSDSQPKSPDLTATDASLTQEHIDRLETLKARTTDPQLRTAIEDAIEELSAQGGSTEIVYA